MQTKNIRTTPVGRVSFPHIFEPTQVPGSSDMKYQITLIFDHTADLQQMRADARAAAAKKFPNGLPANFRDPFLDGTAMGRPETAGKTVVRFSANTNRPHPGVVDQLCKPVGKQDGKLYAGCYARLTYSCYAYDTAGNRGVAFGVNNIQITGDGEALDGRVDAEDDFAAIPSPEDPYGVGATQTPQQPFGHYPQQQVPQQPAGNPYGAPPSHDFI